MVRLIGPGLLIAPVLALAPSAGAAVTQSTVTAPANGAGYDIDLGAPGTVTVSGPATTTNDLASNSVAIVCSYFEEGTGGAALTPAGAAAALTPTGPNTGTFSIPASLDEFVIAA